MTKGLTAAAIAAFLTLSASAAYAQGAEMTGARLEELQQKSIAHFYKFYDTDGDQKVSKEEFMTETEKRFDEMDMNGDGLVTGEEVLAHHSAMQEKMMKERGAVIQQQQNGGAKE